MARYSTVKCTLLLCILLTSKEVTSTSCNDGYYYDENGICISCPPQCLFCDSIVKCLSCENGYWGQVCELQCSKCKTGTGCEKTNGFCFEACRDGLSGILCDASCNEKCRSCNRTNINVCLNCSPGRYPTRYCDRLCSNCNNTACDENGVCSSGCKIGYWNKTCESNCPEDCINKSCEIGNGSCIYGSNRKHDEPKSDKDTGKNSMVSVIVGIVAAVIAVVLCLVGVIIFRRKIPARGRSDETSRHSAGQRKKTTEVESSTPLMKGPDTVLANNTLQVTGKQRTGRKKLLDFIKRLQTKTDKEYQEEFDHLPMGDTGMSRGETDSIKRCAKQYKVPIDRKNCVIVKMDNGENVSMNASFITTRNSTNSVYVASKGPQKDEDGGFERFWMMLWQLECKTVVMLNSLDDMVEANLKEYWPMGVKPEYYGQLYATYESYEEKKEVYISRTIKVKMGEETKSVTQLQYKEWPEKCCAANVGNLLNYLKLVHEANKADKRPQRSPLVVHGSAGAGRTGTFIALDMLIQEAKYMLDSADETDLDVFTCVKHLRRQRKNMVENVEQYRFLHEALSCYITQMLKLNSELSDETQDIHREDKDENELKHGIESTV